MKLNLFTKLSLNITLLGIIGILGTFMSDYLQQIGFFGDTLVRNAYYSEMYGVVSKQYSWGMRHYWYAWTCGALVVIQIIRIANIIINHVESDNKQP